MEVAKKTKLLESKKIKSAFTISKKSIETQEECYKKPLSFVQLKGQGPNTWHWPSITQGEISQATAAMQIQERNAR